MWVASGIVWLAIASVPSAASGIVTALAFGLIAAALIACLRGRQMFGIAAIAYLAPLQPAMRYFSSDLPFLLLEYSVPILAMLLIVQSVTSRRWSAATLWLLFFAMIELFDLARSDSWLMGRAVLFPTVALLAFVAAGDKSRLSRVDVQTITTALLAGAVGLMAIVLRAYGTGQVVEWAQNSNFDASGGMGPNQVSVLFATASFFALTWADRTQHAGRLLLRSFAAVLTILMVLTFSRGGLYMLAGAVAAYYLVLAKPTFQRMGAVLAAILVMVLALQVSQPITEGAVIARYSETTTSNRMDIFLQAWGIFLENPIMGIGTGRFFMAVSATSRLGIIAGAHNELGRAAAEHGIFGLLTWGAFAVAAIAGAWRRRPHHERALRTTIAAMALAIMFYNGLKLITPGLLLFLAGTEIDDEQWVKGQS